MDPDLLRRLAAPALEPTRAALITAGFPAPVRNVLSILLDCAGLLAITGALAVAASIGTRIPKNGVSPVGLIADVLPRSSRDACRDVRDSRAAE